ncbi:hypothetical protein UC34_25170 [Pandoraea vervacti]|uniref:Transglycosylase SLT domain-containing protein n=2 Tax=Pandoraea vervacti TaxID=656178 RepID=A0ABN4U701_9BURK|nr:hypothetical protein UC34_25170 [Pandoraea vervacti]
MADRADRSDWESVVPPVPTELPYDALVRRTARATSVDAALLHAIIDTESGYDPQAVSERGAIGLMQILPRTGQRFGVRRLEDPAENLRAGASYLRWLLSRFDGDVSLALAAYNAGEGAVLRYGRRVPPFPETRNYVRKVLAGYTRLRGAGESGAVTTSAPASDMPPATAVSAKPEGRASARQTSGATQIDGPERTDDDVARTWRLLQGLGTLITHSPGAGAERAAHEGDQPAVLMPSRGRERTAGVGLRPDGRDG